MKIFFFLLQLGLAWSYFFSFKTKKELLGLLDKVYHDYLVFLTYNYQFFHGTSSNTIKLFQLYNFDKKKLLSMLEAMIPEDVNEQEFGSQSKSDIYLNKVPSYIISDVKWETAVRMVINTEIYLYRKNKVKAFNGSISRYVNYFTKSKLVEHLKNFLTENEEVDNTSIFIDEILGFKEEPKMVSDYVLTINSVEYLKKLCINVLNYLMKAHKISESEYCSRTKEFYEEESSQNLMKFLIDNFKSASFDEFNSEVIFEGHKFIDYVKQLEDKTRKKDESKSRNEELIKYAKIGEEYNKMAVSNWNSFKYLNEYISVIPETYLLTYLIKQVEKYRELTEIKRLDDIYHLTKSSSTQAIQNMISSQSYDTVIRWIINLKKLELNSSVKEEAEVELQKYLDVLYLKSFGAIKKEIIILIHNLKDTSMESILNKVEPNYDENSQFDSYLKGFPKFVLNNWAYNIMTYDHNRRGKFGDELTEDPFLMSKSTSLSQTKKLVGVHKELKEMATFSLMIDNNSHYGRRYANLPFYLSLHSLRELKKWFILLDNYHKTKSKTENVKKGDPRKDKQKIIDNIVYYFDCHPELNNLTYLDDILGHSEFHDMINKRNITILNADVKYIYRFYRMRNFRIQESKKLYNVKFDDYMDLVEEIDYLKLFIYSIAKIYPELQIISVYEEVVSGYLFNEEYEPSDIDYFISRTVGGDHEKMLSLAYKFERYYNSTLQLNQRVDNHLEEKKYDQLYIYIKQILNSNKVLLENFNLARLYRNQTHILYGGIAPLISRLNREKLFYLMKKLVSLAELPEPTNLHSYSLDQLKKHIISLIERLKLDNSIEKVMSLINFMKVDWITDDINKNQLINYALLTEYIVRKRPVPSGSYTIINEIHDLTRAEIIDYIAFGEEAVNEELGIRTKEGYDIACNIYGFDNHERYYLYVDEN